jgi:cytochrome c-type protein NapC
LDFGDGCIEEGAMKTRRARIGHWTLILIAVLAVLAGIGFSYTTAVEIEKTESGSFCAKCHTMAPMAIALSRSVHGGHNRYGIAAQCTDCHLPHHSLAGYIFKKGAVGLHDIFAEVFTDTADINWTAKRNHAKTFVYNSGCLSCHNSLDHSKMEKIDPAVVKKIMDKSLKMSCIECHTDVGHKWNKTLLEEIKSGKATVPPPLNTKTAR